MDALNAGLRAATGELIVQLDADASIETPAWVEKMVAFFVSDPCIGVVTGKVVTDTCELQACGIHVLGPNGYHARGCEVTEPAGRRTSREAVRRFRDGQWPASEQIAEVDSGIGVCMMYRRAAAIEVGGYDRGYAPVWLDDVDLTISMRRIGLKVLLLSGRTGGPSSGQAGPIGEQPAAIGPTRGPRSGCAAPRYVAPSQARAQLVHALGWDRGPRWYRQRVAQHFRYWRRKWGWDMLKPDMEAVWTDGVRQRSAGSSAPDAPGWRASHREIRVGQARADPELRRSST